MQQKRWSQRVVCIHGVGPNKNRLMTQLSLHDALGFFVCLFFGVGHRVHAKIEIMIMRRPDINAMGVNDLRTRRRATVHLYGVRGKKCSKPGCQTQLKHAIIRDYKTVAK